jgi:hypothetical protein
MNADQMSTDQLSTDKLTADKLSAEQIDALRVALRDASREPGRRGDALDPMESHLSDAQFIAISVGTLLDAELQECSMHLALCSDCEREVERLRNLNGVWANETDAARLRDRRRAAGSSSISIALEGIIIGFQAALRTLIPPRGAYAHPADDDGPAVEFLVEDGSEPVLALIGTLKRRNRDYYARIDEDDGEGEHNFSNRAVLLTITNPPSVQPVVSRRIDVGVAVLLGTDLPLTEVSMLDAQLLPLGEG